MFGLARAATVAALRARLDATQTAAFQARRDARHADARAHEAERRAATAEQTVARLRRRLRAAKAAATATIVPPAAPRSPVVVPDLVRDAVCGWDAEWAREDQMEAFDEARQAAGGDWRRVVPFEGLPS